MEGTGVMTVQHLQNCWGEPNRKKTENPTVAGILRRFQSFSGKFLNIAGQPQSQQLPPGGLEDDDAGAAA